MFWAKQLNDSNEWNKFATALLYSLNIDYGKCFEVSMTNVSNDSLISYQSFS